VGLSNGILFNIRVKDTYDQWGPTFRSAYKYIASIPGLPRDLKITAAEYFIGLQDPGLGNATPLLVFDGNYNDALETVLTDTINLVGLSNGILFNIRVKDAYDQWGPTFRSAYKFVPTTPGVARNIKITAGEYYFGIIDPGQGNGFPMFAVDNQFDESVESIIRDWLTWYTANSPTVFNIRIRDEQLKWGPVYKRTVFPTGIFNYPNLIQQNDSLRICPQSQYTLTYCGPAGMNVEWRNKNNQPLGTGNNLQRVSEDSGYVFCIATSTTESFRDSIYIGYFPIPQPTTNLSGTIYTCQTSSFNLSTPNISGHTVQWYLNNTAINGATNTTYLPTQNGSYMVKSTNLTTGCSGFSSIINLVNNAQLSTPDTVITCVFPFVISTSLGTNNIYQWKRNGVLIPGANSHTFSTNQAGNYSVSIQNGTCVVNSRITTLIDGVPSRPIISTLNTINICENSSVVLGILPSPNVTYQWFRNGQIIAGATNSTFNVTMNGSYYLKAMGISGCSTNSDTVTVNQHANPNPSIAILSSSPFCEGDTLTLSTQGNQNEFYQWQLNGLDIQGATSNSVQVVQTGIYTVVVYNSLGCTTISQGIPVEFVPKPSAFLTLNNATTFCLGDSIDLSVPFNSNHLYVWTRNGVILNNSNNFLRAFDGGVYQVRVSNQFGCISWSQLVQLNILQTPFPSIYSQSATVVCQGNQVLLETLNDSALFYQWHYNGIPIAGATQSQYYANSTGNYQVKASNSAGCYRMSNAISVQVNQPDTVMLVSNNPTTICSGTYSRISILHSGASNIAWFRNGQIIAGANQNYFFATESGIYKATFLNAFGCLSRTSEVLISVQSTLDSISISACGAAKTARGNWVYASGVYRDTLINVLGCDSIIIQNIAIQQNCINVPNTSVCIGDTAVVPITNSLFSNVASAVLTLTINNPGAQFIGISNVNPVLNGYVVQQVPPNRIVFTWSGLSEVILNSGILFELRIVAPSNTNLNWSNISGECELADFNLNVIQADFISGSVIAHGFVQNINQFICTGDSFSIGNQTFYQSGNYSVSTGRHNHCDSIFNINLQTLDRYLFNSDTVYSCLDSITISAQNGFSNYTWSNGITESHITVTQSGWQTCSAFLGSCSVLDSVYVLLNLADSNNLIIHTNTNSLCPGSSLQLHTNIGLPNFSFIWKRNGQVWQVGTGGSNLPTITEPGSYLLLAYRADGCSTLSNTLIINSNNCNSISGTLTYDNNMLTPMPNVMVRLFNSSSQLIASSVTSNTGQFYFSGISNDTFSYGITVPHSWGGVNATDVLGLQRYATGLISLSPLRIAAADVNANNAVNTSDALIMNRRYANQISSFPAGNFAFVSPNTITSGNPIVQNLRTVCFGDLNGSYNPIFQPRFSYKPLDRFLRNDPLLKKYLSEYKIPLYINQELNVSAVSLVLKIPYGLIIKDVIINSIENQNDVIFNQIGNEIRIAWHSLAYWECSTASPLLWLVLDPSTNINIAPATDTVDSFDEGEVFEIEETQTELANNIAVPYSNVKITIPALKIIKEEPILFKIYPNPTNGFVYFNGHYDLIEVYDQLGRRVLSIDKLPQVTYFDLGHLSEGVYTFKVHSGLHQKIEKVIFNKSARN
jgi:hypothetical protein